MAQKISPPYFAWGIWGGSRLIKYHLILRVSNILIYRLCMGFKMMLLAWKVQAGAKAVVHPIRRAGNPLVGLHVRRTDYIKKVLLLFLGYACGCLVLTNIPSSLEGSQWTPAFMGLQWPSCRNVGVTLSFWWWGACLTNHIFWYRISNNDRIWLGKINWFSSVIGEKLRCPWPLVAEGWLLS